MDGTDLRATFSLGVALVDFKLLHSNDSASDNFRGVDSPFPTNEGGGGGGGGGGSSKPIGGGGGGPITDDGGGGGGGGGIGVGGMLP